MCTHVFFARAINLGARNRVKMKDLEVLAGEAGLSQAWTFGQSGNLVGDIACSAAQIVSDRIQAALSLTCSSPIPMTHRSIKGLEEIANSAPWIDRSTSEQLYSILFLQRRPDAAHVADFLLRDFAPDRAAVNGTEVYISYDSTGHRTLGNGLVERQLKTMSTARNLATVRGILRTARAR